MDPHPWRSAPYRTDLCPVCSSPHHPLCQPPPPFNGARFPPPYPYPSPRPLPPPLPSWPHPPVPPPVDFSDIREGSRKRMRVEDPYDPYAPTNHRVLNLIKNHGQENELQYSNIGSYHNNPIQPSINPNNPYYNSYPVSQSVNQSYRPPSYTQTSVHGDAFYSHMDPNPYQSYGYQPDPLRPALRPSVPPPIHPHFPVMLNNPSSYNMAQTMHLPPREGQPMIYPSLQKPNKINERETNSIRKTATNQVVKINACNLFHEPHRASRPDNFVIILRGLPGSGKSYLAKALFDLEVKGGGDAPRIHSMDDYFMIEVEKDIDESEGSNSKSRGKKLTKKVIEYCYESEMEETYRSSMLKAFKKTLDEGKFTFVIERFVNETDNVYFDGNNLVTFLVDDRNLRVADFTRFWALAKRSGYEVYLLEVPYKDPTGCVARNVHGFKMDEIKKMEAQWEEAPPLYLQLDIQTLFRGDNLKEETIQEVDMDLEDSETVQPITNHVSDNSNTYINTNIDNVDEKSNSPDNKPKIGERYDSEDEETIGVKNLGQSKWSRNTEDERENLEDSRRNTSTLSGSVQPHSKSKSRKYVHWSDRADKGGFSIGTAAKNRTNLSLIIGPGSGYNLKSNSLIQEEKKSPKSREKENYTEIKRLFAEQQRAETKSFKAVFDQRKDRIGGLNNGADDE